MIVEHYINICKQDNSLRDYQQEAKHAIFEAWDEVNSVMFQMPTGTGKTRLFTSIIKDINDFSVVTKQPVKILVIAHRTELIDQIDRSLLKYSIAHGIIAGGYDRNLKMPVQVASIQTLVNKHNIDDAKRLKVNFVIIDEAHHSLARTYQMLWKLYPCAKRLGVTATPWRMSGNGFTSLFDKLLKSWNIKEFISRNYLSGYQYYSLKLNNPISNTIDGIDEYDPEGDYKVSALERAMNTSSIRAQLLDTYLTLADGKKGIIYAISQAHSRKICDEFAARGIKIAAIDSKTPKDERQKLVNEFRLGKLTIIVNVDIFSEGFDCPDIEFVQLARPTRSLAKYLQQVGRALRPTEAKSHAIILDNVGMYERFGLPDARRHWLHHFIGSNQSTEEIVKNIQRLGDGMGRICNLKEGHEPMVLIQQTSDFLGEEENVVVKKWPAIGEIRYESGFVWKDPKHEYRNGVHYYTDVHGQKFCLYPDKNGNWEFDLVLPKDPSRRKVLIKRDFGSIAHATEFSLYCMLARATGDDILYIGFENSNHDSFQLMDFFAPIDYDGSIQSIMENRLFFDEEGIHYEKRDDFWDNHSYEVPEDDEVKKETFDEKTTPLAAAVAKMMESIGGPDYVPNTEPIALLSYDVRFVGERIHIIANMNNGTSEPIFDWSIDSDFAHKIVECEKNETPYEVLGVIKFVRKYYDKVLLYTQLSTGEIETLEFLSVDGAFYTDENSLIPVEHPQQKQQNHSKQPNVSKQTAPKKIEEKTKKESPKKSVPVIYADKSEPTEEEILHRPRYGKRWTVSEIVKLKAYYAQGHKSIGIAMRLQRTEAEVLTKLLSEGYIRWDERVEKFIKVK